MQNILNLDQFESPTSIIIKGKTYTVNPISYDLANSFLKVNKNTEMSVLLELLAQYLNNNQEAHKVDVNELRGLLNMKQILALTEHIVKEIVEIEKN